MSYKTEYANIYDEDNFAQIGNQMNELTVTITLCEYRNMVRELARQEMIIDRMCNEAAELEKTIRELKGEDEEREENAED